jgi:predicted Zn-dependent protease
MMRAKATSAYARDKSIPRDHYKNLISEGDDSLPTAYGYALALSENAEYGLARKEFAKLLKQHPNNITLRLGQAENEQYANQVDESLFLFRSLYEEQIAQGNHLVDIYYANALVLVKRHKTAIPILRSAIANNRNEPYFHHLLSRAYGESGDQFRSFQERGEYHYQRGNYEFSLKQFERAKTLTESSYELARIGARIEDVELEIEAIKKL